jgi:hypothetical protein
MLVQVKGEMFVLIWFWGSGEHHPANPDLLARQTWDSETTAVDALFVP